MCGIVGVASRQAITDREWLGAGCAAMAHRGPDDNGIWWSPNGTVGLAQTRLAIIDLSPGGHQPMHDETNRLSIVFNGEIYNYLDLRPQLMALGHKFHTESDTEVVLAAYHQWGTDCLAHLNGMFALALYDGKRNLLFLARDRAGEKPMFYSTANGGIRFASELKALLADPAFDRKIEPAALDCYLMMGYVPGEACILQSARKLPPAHALTFNLASEETKIWRYWRMPAAPDDNAGDEEALVDELEVLLADAVRRQLVADVPVGILLSGGVDSSLVTAMAARASSRVKTFTVGFDGYGNYDETGFARLIANHFGTEHIELQAGHTGPEILNVLAPQYDEPLNDSSMIPTFLVSQLVRQHCKVALGGDGGDEMFGGYEQHRRLLWMKSKVDHVPLGLRKLAAAAGDVALPTGFRGRNWIQALAVDFNTRLPSVAAHFGASERRALMGPGWQTPADAIREMRVPVATDLLQRVTRMDFENYMPEDILVKVDRASMLASLEMRAPLLDFRIAEFAFGKVPSRLKASFSERKILLKRLSKRVLPPQFDADRKQGFSIPLPTWLKAGPWRDFVSDVLLDPKSTFDRRAVSNLIDGHGKRRNNSERLFGLTMFELWRRAYGI
ncbi:asparagine synthase (glutamine-hydrolyzing) [Bradyrhizobium sp.]|jgi:asparagine synthase (glutamine-hydrolysing)|uniref:asparagine synthase (glutamine-hydrolyzing) n=1 Tax=Bradyrhizobium sp. TaxID=376 RepID=UPI002E072675|nr:asparagine synthase (glutamine-hydrolyzing) [Bradyrhizobium sp.]